MNLRQLEYFRTLAKTEHYGKASSMLYITQPSLSQAISELEKELSVKLFEKKGRNIKLTAYGRFFLPYVEQGLEQIELGAKKLQQISNMNRGKISVAHIYSLGASFLPSLIQSFHEDCKNWHISFSISQGTTKEIVNGIKNEDYDIAFCTYKENEPDVEFLPLEKQKVVLIAHKDHELVKRKSVNLPDLQNYPLICFNKKSMLRPLVDDMFLKAGIKVNISYEVAEDSALLGLVNANLGIGILPYVPLLKSYDVRVLTTTKPIYEQIIYLTLLKNKYQSPTIKNFIDFILVKQKHSDLLKA